MNALEYSEVGTHGLPEAGEAVTATASLVAPMNPNPAFDESEPDSFETNPLNTITGVVWGSLIGGALWTLLLLALIFLD